MQLTTNDEEIWQILHPTFLDGAGVRFKEARKQLMLTQIAVAEELGCSQGQIAKIEAGIVRRVSFSYSSLKRLFGAQVKFILLGSK